jgi:hypothetical protein
VALGVRTPPVSTTACSRWATSMNCGWCPDTEFIWSLIDLRPLRSCCYLTTSAGS